jgi:hypothetical protein
MASHAHAVFVLDIEDILVNTIEAGGNSIVQREGTTIEVIEKAVESVKEILTVCSERGVHPLFFIYTLERNLDDIHAKIDLFSSRIPGFSFTRILRPTTTVNPRKTYGGIVHLYKKVYGVRPSGPIFFFDTERIQFSADNLYPLLITDAGFDEGQSWNLALEKIREVLPSYVSPEPLAPGSLTGAFASASDSDPDPSNLSPMLAPINLTPILKGGKRNSRQSRKCRMRKTRRQNRKSHRSKSRAKK